ncbi:Retrovirus-related Pol polyprotein from transposon TNT 1-94 [Bienertia sinuspersici]
MLDDENSQYASWVEYFKIHVCAYNVMDHIDATIPRPTNIDDHTWLRLDTIVKQWIYATISKDLAATILKSGTKAIELWTRLEEIFQDKKETCVIYLDEQLANTKCL